MNKDSKCVKRLLDLFDEGTFEEIGAKVRSGSHDAEVVTGCGYVDGTPVYAFSQNREVNGGAMGKVHAAKIAKIYSLAEKTGLPVIGIYDSEGAYLSEGLGALDAYGTLVKTANNLSGVVPQISVVAGVCAGTSAVMAISADIVIMTKDAKLCLNAQSGDSAEAAEKNGTAHAVFESDEQAIECARRIVNMLPVNNLAVVPSTVSAEPSGKACCPVGTVIDDGSKIPLSKKFGKSVKTVLARISGVTCGFVKISADDGVVGADDCVKAARFVRMCDSFSLPVITFVDAERFGDKSVSALRAAAMLSHAYAEATTVKISVVTGKACGAVFACVASKSAQADLVLALDTAIISVIDPEAAALTLMSDRREKGESLEALAKEYERENCSPDLAAADGFIDDVVTVSELRGKLISALDMLSGKRVSGLDKKHSNMPL